MQVASIPENYAPLADLLRPKLSPWRKFTIAIDGVDNSGKSSLARFLAWQLGMPAIETDLMLSQSDVGPWHDGALISRLVTARHQLNRPVIVEGVFVLAILRSIDIAPDILVRVEAAGRTGSITWRGKFLAYLEEYPRAKAPDYVINWEPVE
jgi:hypothetical protein